MDPASYRFELLQLEIADVEKTKVSDMLAQIPNSVTEPKLKGVAFDGILDPNYYGYTAAEETGQSSSARIIDAFGDKQNAKRSIFVARPKGTSNADTLMLARSTLLSKDVSGKLDLSGFDLSGWKSMKDTSKK